MEASSRACGAARALRGSRAWRQSSTGCSRAARACDTGADGGRSGAHDHDQRHHHHDRRHPHPRLRGHSRRPTTSSSRIFGFTSGGLHRLDDGTVVHGEVRNGDAAIWLHRVTAEHELDLAPRRGDVARWPLGRRPRRRRALRPRQGRRRPDRERADGPGLRPARVRRRGTPRTTAGGSRRRCPDADSRPPTRRAAGAGPRVGGPAASGGPTGPPGSRPRSRRRGRWRPARRGRPRR